MSSELPLEIDKVVPRQPRALWAGPLWMGGMNTSTRSVGPKQRRLQKGATRLTWIMSSTRAARSTGQATVQNAC